MRGERSKSVLLHDTPDMLTKKKKVAHGTSIAKEFIRDSAVVAEI